MTTKETKVNILFWSSTHPANDYSGNKNLETYLSVFFTLKQRENSYFSKPI